MSFDKIKIKYILSTLDNQIKEGKQILDINKNDYEYVINNINFKISNVNKYKGKFLNITGV